MIKAKDRIVQFIDYKRLSKRKFCEEISVSHTIFNSVSSLGSDKLEIISNKYPELNMDWVITGRGKMVSKVITEKEDCKLCNEWKEKYFNTLEKYNSCLELQENIKSN